MNTATFLRPVYSLDSASMLPDRPFFATIVA
jgi:hypothetical protein